MRNLPPYPIYCHGHSTNPLSSIIGQSQFILAQNHTQTHTNAKRFYCEVMYGGLKSMEFHTGMHVQFVWWLSSETTNTAWMWSGSVDNGEGAVTFHFIAHLYLEYSVVVATRHVN